jgi:DNA-binding LacI/PurR family transcriptional regulator
MSLISVHDAWFAPALTTVRLPLRDLGAAAVDVLLVCSARQAG